MKQLQIRTIASVILCFSITVSTILAYFIVSARAHGWPQKDFFLEVPAQAKARIIAVTFLIFHIPVFVSCIFYFTLLYSVKRSSKVCPFKVKQAEILSKEDEKDRNDTSGNTQHLKPNQTKMPYSLH